MLTEKFLAGRRRSRFSEDEKQALEASVARVREFGPRQLIVREGDRTLESSYLVEGVACRYLDSEDGGRQYVGLHVAGDFVDLHGFPLERLDHNVAACTAVKIAVVPHTAISRIMNEMPHLACMLWFSTLLDAAIHRNWIMCLGRLPALARVSHLLCELNVRMQLVGLSDGRRFDLPLRQEDVADATGLTPVHVNRMLRELRELGLVEFRQSRVEILDWTGLQRTAEFDPAYLYADDSAVPPRDDDARRGTERVAG